jgi:uncharacterized protein (TIGR03435 family)
MSRLLRLAAILLLLAPALHAQARLEFDVASVRENTSGEAEDQTENIPLSADDTFRQTGGVLRATNTPLRKFIGFAWKVNGRQREVFLASLPAWAQDIRYNIEARTDRPNVTKDEMRLMMRALLEDRFHIKTHLETRQVNVYAAVLVTPGKLGPGLRPHPADASCTTIANSQARPTSADEPPPPKALADGFPRLCGDFTNIPVQTPGHRREGSRNVPLSTITSIFTGMGQLDRPTVDQTGLTGNYDFVMEFRIPLPPNFDPDPPIPGPDFLDALKTQLGIKLIPTKAPVEFFLVDHLERPTGN